MRVAQKRQRSVSGRVRALLSRMLDLTLWQGNSAETFTRPPHLTSDAQLPSESGGPGIPGAARLAPGRWPQGW